MVQLALIVDDSKTARLLLRKMLERHHIPVAMVESGEEALEYLLTNTPDMIFMDHMMPGMDGFAAVKAIKSDPEKSSIPIIMHTTKQGDIYVGQARALGAIDILAKPASDQDLISVLGRVKRAAVQDRSAADFIATVPSMPTVSIDSALELGNNPVAASTSTSGDNAGLADTVASFDRQNTQHTFLGTVRQWLVVVIWLVPSLWLLNLYFTQQQALQGFQQQQVALFKSVEWLLNKQSAYDYGELPMAGARLELLKALIPKLELAGFKGVVRLEGHTGDFCLSQIPLDDGSEMLMLPRPELPMTDCDVIGVSKTRARALSIEQSSAFLKFLQSLKSQSTDIRVELAAYGDSAPRLSYPDNIEGVTTGDWNAIALDNNRVQYVLIAE